MKNQPQLSTLFYAIILTVALGTTTRVFAADDAAALYAQSCASCHGDKGHGDGAAAKYLNPKPRDFATSLRGKTDEWIAKAIKGGGPAVGESPTMPASSKFSTTQIKGLVAYIKAFNS